VGLLHHLQDGQEFQIPLQALLKHGEDLFVANWTDQEGGGRPLTKGTGQPLSDVSAPLEFPRDFNRISAPDANSCAGCHNAPFGIVGGGGDFVTSVFVLGQRFDFASFDPADLAPTKGTVNETGAFVTQQTIANRRATLGMFGSGYIEMLARQMTADLQAIRDATGPGQSNPLITKGISFGVITRDAQGNWDTSGVEGLPVPSLTSTGPDNPPNLIIRPFHQAGAVVSIRQFTNNAFNHHHGIQTTERFGIDTDPDGDGFVNEMTRADMTASVIHQATLPVPGRVIPNNPLVEAAVLVGEKQFGAIGCAGCHTPSLPLDNEGWIFSEPNPYNPATNLQPGDAPVLEVDLTRPDLPSPRLAPENGVVYVPAFTDLKLHDICGAPDDPNIEPLDMNQPAGSPKFFAGNRQFLTRKLWGAANEPPYFHHGQFTTLRQAILAHDGEALASRLAFEALDEYNQSSIIEFLKTLQVLPPGTKYLVVDENGRQKVWPPRQ
jgi:cytochrome c peroxidase